MYFDLFLSLLVSHVRLNPTSEEILKLFARVCLEVDFSKPLNETKKNHGGCLCECFIIMKMLPTYVIVVEAKTINLMLALSILKVLL